MSNTPVSWGGGNYSLDEQIVGKWIDGKPIYQKSIPFDNSSVRNLTINVDSLNIDRFINYSFSTGLSVNGNNQVSASGVYVNDTDYLNCYLNTESTNDKLTIRCGTDWFKTTNGVVTIQYTKTTD